MTRNTVNNIILRHKPNKVEEDEPDEEESDTKADSQPAEDSMDYLYYYGLLIVKHTVICIFKNNPDIAVTPADVNIIINYSIFNVENKFDENEGSKE